MGFRLEHQTSPVVSTTPLDDVKPQPHDTASAGGDSPASRSSGASQCSPSVAGSPYALTTENICRMLDRWSGSRKGRRGGGTGPGTPVAEHVVEGGHGVGRCAAREGGDGEAGEGHGWWVPSHPLPGLVATRPPTHAIVARRDPLRPSAPSSWQLVLRTGLGGQRRHGMGRGGREAAAAGSAVCGRGGREVKRRWRVLETGVAAA
uniref:Uncharacterized protein n=1 Tax=Arundo donax TaxID=35708 RepID=A0A0A8YMT6_ARUDO